MLPAPHAAHVRRRRRRRGSTGASPRRRLFVAALAVAGVVGAVRLLPWALLLGVRPLLVAPTTQLPVGDAMRVVGRHVRTLDTPVWSDSVRRDSEGSLGRFYEWRVESASDASAGAARIDARGVLTAMAPGRVRVRAGVLGTTGTLDVEIVPRVVDFGATPSEVTVRVDDHVPVHVRARLDGGMQPDWVATITLPPPGRDLALGVLLPQPVAVPDSVPYEPAHEAWVIDVAGRQAGNTTLHVQLGARELAIPVTVVDARH